MALYYIIFFRPSSLAPPPMTPDDPSSPSGVRWRAQVARRRRAPTTTSPPPHRAVTSDVGEGRRTARHPLFNTSTTGYVPVNGTNNPFWAVTPTHCCASPRPFSHCTISTRPVFFFFFVLRSFVIIVVFYYYYSFVRLLDFRPNTIKITTIKYNNFRCTNNSDWLTLCYYTRISVCVYIYMPPRRVTNCAVIGTSVDRNQRTFWGTQYSIDIIIIFYIVFEPNELRAFISLSRDPYCDFIVVVPSTFEGKVNHKRMSDLFWWLLIVNDLFCYTWSNFTSLIGNSVGIVGTKSIFFSVKSWYFTLFYAYLYDVFSIFSCFQTLSRLFCDGKLTETKF